MSLEICPKFSPIFDKQERRRYRLNYGGRGSGKSFTMAVANVTKTYDTEHRKILYLRQTMTSSEDSTYADVKLAMETMDVLEDFAEKGGNFTNRYTGNQIIFKGIRATGTQSAKLKSLSGVTDLVIEEAEEVESFEEFSKVDESIRMKDIDLTVTLIFNPTSAIKSWIHQEWFVDGLPNPEREHDTVFIKTTYKDNLKNLNPAVVKRYEDLKLKNPTYYLNNILAEWTLESENRVYDGWGELPSWFSEETNYSRWYGLDFGYGGKDATALIEITLFEEAYYIKEIFCKSGLSIGDTATLMRQKGVPANALIIADSAVPTLIWELRRAGYRGIRRAKKGPNSLGQGIKRLQGFHIVMIGGEKNVNLWYAYNTFAWKKDGGLPHEPDILAALRYALTYKNTKASGGSISAGSRVIRSSGYI